MRFLFVLVRSLKSDPCGLKSELGAVGCETNLC